MSTLVLAIALAVGANEQVGAAGAAATPKIEGKWMITYAEERGRRNNAWEQRQATVRGTTLSFEQDGREQSLQLTFGPNQTVRATAGRGQGGGADRSAGTLTGTHSGVFIAAQDFFCISLNPGTGADRRTPGQEGGQVGADKARGESSGAFILILRRQRQ